MGIPAQSNGIAKGLLCVLILLLTVVPPRLARAQDTGQAGVLFKQTFDEPNSHRELRRAGGGARKEESITHAESGVKAGNRSVKVSFIPGSGRHWYYKLRCNIRVDPDQLLKIEGSLKFKTQGRFDPLASIRLGLTYNCYADDTYKKVTARSSVHSISGLYTPETWQVCKGEPFNLIQKLADKGRQEKYLIITNMLIMVLDMPLHQRLQIWVDDIALVHATQADVDAYRESIKVDYEPQPYSKQANNYYYGYTGGLYSGWNRWDRPHQFMNKEKRALTNIEFMLNGYFTQVFDYGHKIDPEGSNVDRIVSDMDLLYGYGIHSGSVCYLTPYYYGERSFEQCEAVIRETIPKLKKAKGLTAYLVLDEPKPERKVLDHWVWTKKLFRELDPDTPCSGPMNSHNRLRYYAQTEHTLWIDEYPIRGRFFDEYTNGPAGILSLENANRISAESGAKQVWNMNQVFSHTGPGLGPRLATPAEHRLGNYISLATGGRALQYFSMCGYLPHTIKRKSGHTLGKRIIGFGTPVGAPAFPAGREVFKQGPIPPTFGPLLIPTAWDRERSLPVSCADLPYPTSSKNKKVIGFGLNTGKEYDVLVVYNRDTLHTQSGSISLAEVLRERDLYDLFADKLIPHAEGMFSTGNLEAGGGRMYVLCSAAVYRKIRRAVARNSYVLKKRLYDFYYREQRNNGLNMDRFREAFRAPRPDAGSRAALALLDSTYGRLKSREDGDTPFAETHGLLREAQSTFVAIAEGQVKYLSCPTPKDISALVKVEAYHAWYDEAVKLSDTYVLLRNLLYFGKANAALPLARRLVPLMAAQLSSNQSGSYVSIGPDGVNALHREALSLNSFNLLDALRDNLR
ncbi:MAG: hypothetical protein HN742_23990 [Lentisphaerae bacterium]|jgi:hypothetical protein|nr:hypothetical protein [Lentisphaerota bacterium]MBT4821359.1 hypothetical protein [Lentisphaerota bacterium]MBT5612577.1 hypothetical protein [Lentisphaerota bacterium]MBT7844959.1 hypothetical protein [Lentisphaerota bacterium]